MVRAMTSEEILAMLKALLAKSGMDPALLDKIGLDQAMLDEADAKSRPGTNTHGEGQMEITLRLPTPVALQLCHLLETGVLYGSLVTNAGDVKRKDEGK